MRFLRMCCCQGKKQQIHSPRWTRPERLPRSLLASGSNFLLSHLAWLKRGEGLSAADSMRQARNKNGPVPLPCACTGGADLGFPFAVSSCREYMTLAVGCRFCVCLCMCIGFCPLLICRGSLLAPVLRRLFTNHMHHVLVGWLVVWLLACWLACLVG